MNNSKNGKSPLQGKRTMFKSVTHIKHHHNFEYPPDNQEYRNKTYKERLNDYVLNMKIKQQELHNQISSNQNKQQKTQKISDYLDSTKKKKRPQTSKAYHTQSSTTQLIKKLGLDSPTKLSRSVRNVHPHQKSTIVLNLLQEQQKDIDQPDLQPSEKALQRTLTINIEVCQNCQEHQNQHEEKEFFFSKLFTVCQEQIEKHMPIAQVIQNSGIQHPKIGSFEVRHGQNLIWSTLLFNEFPDPEQLAIRVENYFYDYKVGNDLTNYNYKTVIRQFQETEFQGNQDQGFINNQPYISYPSNLALSKSVTQKDKYLLNEAHHQFEKSLGVHKRHTSGNNSTKFQISSKRNIHSPSQKYSIQKKQSNNNNISTHRKSASECISPTKQEEYQKIYQSKVDDLKSSIIDNQIKSLQQISHYENQTIKENNHDDKHVISFNIPNTKKNMDMNIKINNKNMKSSQQYNDKSLSPLHGQKQGFQTQQPSSNDLKQQQNVLKHNSSQGSLDEETQNFFFAGNNKLQRIGVEKESMQRINSQESLDIPSNIRSHKHQEIYGSQKKSILKTEENDKSYLQRVNSQLQKEISIEYKNLDQFQEMFKDVTPQNYSQLISQNIAQFWNKFKIYYNSFQYNPSFKRIAWEMYDIFQYIKKITAGQQQVLLDKTKLNEQLNEKIQQLDYELKKTVESLLSTKESLIYTQKQLSDSQIQNQSLQNEIIELKRVHDQETVQLSERITDQQNLLQQKNHEIEQNHQKQMELDHKLDSTQSNVSHLSVKLIKQRFQMAGKKSITLSYETKNQILEDRNNILEQDIKKLEKDLKKARQQNSKLLSEGNVSKKEVEAIQNQLEEVKQEKLDQEEEMQKVIQDKNVKEENLVKENKSLQTTLNSVFKQKKIFVKSDRMQVNCYLRTHYNGNGEKEPKFRQSMQASQKISIKAKKDKKKQQDDDEENQEQAIDPENVIHIDFNCLLINNMGDIDEIINSDKKKSDDESVEYISQFQITSGYVDFYCKGYVCKRVTIIQQQLAVDKLQLLQVLVRQQEQWTLLEVKSLYNDIDFHEIMRKNIIKSGIQLTENAKKMLQFTLKHPIKLTLLHNESIPVPQLCYQKQLVFRLTWQTQNNLNLNLSVIAIDMDGYLQENVSYQNLISGDKAIEHQGQEQIQSTAMAEDYDVFKEEIFVTMDLLDEEIETLWVFLSINSSHKHFSDLHKAQFQFLAGDDEFCRYDFENIQDKVSNGCIMAEIFKIGHRWGVRSRGYFTKNTQKSQDVAPIIQEILQNNLQNVKIHKQVFQPKLSKKK